MTNEELILAVDKLQGTVNKMQGSMDLTIEALQTIRKIVELQGQRLDNIEHHLKLDRP